MRIKCNGELLSDEWAELYAWAGFKAGYYSPKRIRDAIAALSPGEELVLEINSVGGDVAAANEIYSAIQVCENPTRAEIQSLAASAASYFPLACDKVEISLPAQMMIHCASINAAGNKEHLRWTADALELTDESTLDVYCKKCGDKADREELRTMMEEETFLSSRRCLELGLVDGIIGAAEQPKEPVRFAATLTGNIITAMNTLPPISELMERRNREQAWKASARQELEAEKKRYYVP